jgi:hypothetical protein
MTRTRKLITVGLAAIAACGVLGMDEEFWISGSHQLVSEANARIGRPLTPLSYAGVARRTTRRVVRRNTVGVGVGVGCVQVVNAYGQIVTRCY